MSTPPPAVDGFDIEHVPIERLHPNEANPRTISKERFAALKHSLGADPDMMLARPVVALRDGTIIMGNMRWRAAADLGWKTIPARLVDLDPTRAQQWLIRDNQEYGEWEEQALAELLFQMAQDGADMLLTGLAEEDLKRILETYGPGGDDPAERKATGSMLALSDVAIPDPDHKPQRGEVWRLGPHSLVCGDVFTGHAQWAPLLGDGAIFVPFPGPSVVHATRVKDNRLVLVQPDPFIAGHVLDEWARHNEADPPERVSA